jgi:hypothetical protein
MSQPEQLLAGFHDDGFGAAPIVAGKASRYLHDVNGAIPHIGPARLYRSRRLRIVHDQIAGRELQAGPSHFDMCSILA